MQNGYKMFNRVYSEAILDYYLFIDIREVRALTEELIEEYNDRRPHEALQNRTPKGNHIYAATGKKWYCQCRVRDKSQQLSDLFHEMPKC